MPYKPVEDRVDLKAWGITPERIRKFQASPAQFRAHLIIGDETSQKRFTPDPWQAENLAALDPLWMKVVRVRKPGRPKFAWLGRPRGHSKTLDEAMQLVWAIAFCPHQIKGIAAAGTQEQATFIKDAVETIILLNPWLGKNGLNLIRSQNFRVLNPRTRSFAKIISSDAPGSYGATPDFILCDELTHWKNKQLWTPLSTAAGKRPNCALIIMTNAGHERSWQSRLRDKAKNNPDRWIYRDMHGPQASWVTKAVLEEQFELLDGDAKAFRRLWWNEWQVEGSDDLDLNDIRACIRHDRGMSGSERAEGWQFIAGVDLSVKKHRSAFVILGVHREQHRIRLAYTNSWAKDPDTGLVDLVKIETEIALQHQTFSFQKVLFDPYQAALMKQQLDQRGVWVEEMSFQGTGATKMAMTILDVFKSRRIELFQNEELIDDLTKLNIVNRGFGYKLEAEADQFGHADTAFALAICLPAAVEMAGMPSINPFVDRSVVQTLDELLQKQHNLDKAAQEEILGKIEKAVAGSAFSVPKPVAPDTRSVLVKALEENVITFGEEMDAA